MEIIYKCCVFKPNGQHCQICEDNVQNIKKLNLIFKTEKEAAKFFNIDVRTVKQWKDILFFKPYPNCEVKYANCEICNKIHVQHRKERKICKKCHTSKEYLKILLPEKYKGINNPNYLHGQSNVQEYQTKEWKQLVKIIKTEKCELCLNNKSTDVHHIIPRVFCKFAENSELVFDKNNLINLCSNCHKGIHHLKLDIELLPNLYLQYKQNAEELKQVFVHLPQVQSVLQLDETLLTTLDLFQAGKYLGNKKLLPIFQQCLL